MECLCAYWSLVQTALRVNRLVRRATNLLDLIEQVKYLLACASLLVPLRAWHYHLAN